MRVLSPLLEYYVSVKSPWRNAFMQCVGLGLLRLSPLHRSSARLAQNSARLNGSRLRAAPLAALFFIFYISFIVISGRCRHHTVGPILMYVVNPKPRPRIYNAFYNKLVSPKLQGEVRALGLRCYLNKRLFPYGDRMNPNKEIEVKKLI